MKRWQQASLDSLRTHVAAQVKHSAACHELEQAQRLAKDHIEELSTPAQRRYPPVGSAESTVR